MLRALPPPPLETVVVVGSGSPRAGEIAWADHLARGAAVAPSAVHEREAQLHADSTADLMFTSGTTGRPKGVMAGHEPTIRAFTEWARVVGLGEGDRYLIINPFFHTFGYKAGWVAAFLCGATVFPHQVFDADAVLERIQSDRISFLPGPPTLFLSMLAHPRLAGFDLSSRRSAVTITSSRVTSSAAWAVMCAVGPNLPPTWNGAAKTPTVAKASHKTALAGKCRCISSSRSMV